MQSACSEGRVQVLKLLVGTGSELNSMTLITFAMASLEQQLMVCNSAPQPRGGVASLLAVGYYLYYLEPTLVMSVIVRSTHEYPRATLTLLREFCKQSHQEKHLVLTGLALVSLPAQWLANPTLTHINVSNNLLTSVPEEVFQVGSLQGLNLSHNCLESIPSVLKWNCPKLKDLELSTNRLVSKPFSILEGRKSRDQVVNANPPSIGKQRDVVNAAQAMLNLTGYNLYPCLRSITRVSISHNPALTQVSTGLIQSYRSVRS